MEERKALALSLKLEGFSYREIGIRMGFSKQRAQQLISPPKEIRNRVFQLANNRCQECLTPLRSNGHVHHKGSDSIEDFNDIDNLQLLCLSCHRKVHPKLTHVEYPKPDSLTNQAGGKDE